MTSDFPLSRTADARSRTISWLHFGDLHITTEDQPNFRDFRALIAAANEYITDGIDFAVLPGDNADDGTAAQYDSIRRAAERLRLPLEVRPGDHDRKSGTLEAYRRGLEPRLWRSRVVGVYRCLFLNSIDGPDKHRFELGPEQRAWLFDQCETARRNGETLVLFLHAYPSEHGASARELRAAIADYRVAVVDMGHTHYNELANDGRTIYAATRSTGQIEEGPVGFSVATIDRGVVSWKFNELDRWPLVQIISPADRTLIVDVAAPDQVVRGQFEIRARVWGGAASAVLSASIDDGEALPMTRIAGTNCFRAAVPAAHVTDGPHGISVNAVTVCGSGHDRITALVSQSGHAEMPHRLAGDLENTVGADAEKGLLGTRLGPNANGRKW